MAQKILVVDDDKEWNLLLKIHLEKSGFVIAQAFNGREAIEKIDANKPDLVILDINMPVMDGWEVCQTLRSSPSTENLPIMILSSYSQVQDIQRGKSFHVKRYLLKPCLPQTVVQNVRDIFTEI
jgi:CheY-like chemotaxis protein